MEVFSFGRTPVFGKQNLRKLKGGSSENEAAERKRMLTARRTGALLVLSVRYWEEDKEPLKKKKPRFCPRSTTTGQYTLRKDGISGVLLVEFVNGAPTA